MEVFRAPERPSVELQGQLAECWQATANAGGAVGFPWPPVPDLQVREAVERLVAAIGAGDTVLVIARDAEGLAGWVSLDYNDARLVEHWATVRRLQTHPRARGRGVGTALMAELVRVAREDRLQQLHMAVRAGLGLEAFYEGLGWRIVGRWPDALRFGEGDYRDEILMAIRLQTADER